MDIQVGDLWNIDGSTWRVTSVAVSTCCMSGPLPCRGMQEMALSYVSVRGYLVSRKQPDKAPVLDRLRIALRSSLELAREWEAEALAAKTARHIEVDGNHEDATLVDLQGERHAARLCITAISREWVALGGKE